MSVEYEVASVEDILAEMGKQFEERAKLKKEILAGITAELLPCPFCGSANIVLGHDTSSDYERHWSWYVECRDCGVGLEFQPTKEATILKWNVRTTQCGK